MQRAIFLVASLLMLANSPASAFAAASASNVTEADAEAAYKRQDYATALRGFLAAAEAGNVRAQHNLGWMYSNGEGVQTDLGKGVQWYERAADNGDAGAQTALGVIYLSGLVPTDDVKALLYLTLATDQSCGDQRSRLNILRDGAARNVSAEALREAEALAKTHPGARKAECLNSAELAGGNDGTKDLHLKSLDGFRLNPPNMRSEPTASHLTYIVCALKIAPENTVAEGSMGLAIDTERRTVNGYPTDVFTSTHLRFRTGENVWAIDRVAGTAVVSTDGTDILLYGSCDRAQSPKF
jgi:hypothetical protein